MRERDTERERHRERERKEFQLNGRCMKRKKEMKGE